VWLPESLVCRERQVVTVVLDRAQLAAHRQRFPAWMDADEFTITA
jgi:predicted amidohydrolase